MGGTGVKAAVVDLGSAELVSARVREKTPQPSTPEAVLVTIASVVESVLAERSATELASPADLLVGCGLPGVIKAGTMLTAANLDKGWLGFPAEARIGEALGRPVRVINDADAAGLAELAFGAARDMPGTVILLTVGTGIGSALISDGRLVPNSELGHLEMRRKGAETLVSGAARTRRGLGWKAWAREFSQYLAMVDFLFSPDRIILGGGVSKDFGRFEKHLSGVKAEIVLARFLNTSGIIGAAYAAALNPPSAAPPAADRG
ncbi:ROK family protein [soil metagenome]